MNAATATIDSWREILIEGSPDQIDSLLAEFEKKLQGKGWKRDADKEKTMDYRPDRKRNWHCFVGGPKDGPRLMLSLCRTSGTRLRGEAYTYVSGPPNTTNEDVAEVIKNIIKEDLEPAASSAELRVEYPRFSESSRVPWGTRDSLREFSDLAAGAWPLDSTHEPLWRRFVILSTKEEAMFSGEELERWFKLNGWTDENANLMVEKLMNDSILIAEYDETMSR